MKKSSFVFLLSLASASFSPAFSSAGNCPPPEHPLCAIPAVAASIVGWSLVNTTSFPESLIGLGAAYAAIRYSPITAGAENPALKAIGWALPIGLLTIGGARAFNKWLEKKGNKYKEKLEAVKTGLRCGLYTAGLGYLAWKFNRVAPYIPQLMEEHGIEVEISMKAPELLIDYPRLKVYEDTPELCCTFRTRGHS